MRVIPVLGLSAALTLLMSGCRTQTGIDVAITTDVPCGTMKMSTGVQLGELTGAEITGESPQAVTEECREEGNGKPNRVGNIVVTASPGNESATFRLTVMANLRPSEKMEPISPDKCKAQKYVDCIVVRRTLGFIPNEELTLPIFLQNACASRVCGEGTTCIADAKLGVRCAPVKMEQPTDCAKPDGCAVPGPTAQPADPEPPPVSSGDVDGGVGTPKLSGPPLYASTKDSFFKVDPESLKVGTGIPFKGCGNDVHDIAVTQDDKLYAFTTDALYEVAQDGTCTPKGGSKSLPIGVGGYPYTLALLPGGIPPKIKGDVLIGQYHNTFLTISPVEGGMTMITPLGCPYASGDVVVLKRMMKFNAYLAVNPNDGKSDYLTEISPVDGKEVKGAPHWPFEATQVYGLAYWGGFFYGFATDGSIIKMNEKDGKTVKRVDPDHSFLGGASPPDASTSPTPP